MKRKHIIDKLLVTAIFITLIALRWIFSIPCPFREFLHISCPGCGMSRAFFALCRLDIPAAFEHHYMVWSLPLLYFYFWFDGRLFKNKRLNIAVIIIIAAGFLINWLVRPIYIP